MINYTEFNKIYSINLKYLQYSSIRDKMGVLFFKTGKEKLIKVEKTFFDFNAKDIDGNLF
jgi:hypothetical protein